MPRRDDITLFYNPKCSKSRAAAALLDDRGIRPRVFDYLNTPLTVEGLSAVKQALAIDDVRDMMRTNEPIFGQLNLADDALSQDALIDAIIANPILLQRPIVTDGERAVIGRPPENILMLFGSG